MASTNKTANYELSQYIGTDIPNPLTDYNSDMEKIDNALTGIAGVAGGAQTGVQSLEEKVGDGTLETEAQNLISAVNELKGESDSLDSRMSTAELGLNSVNNSLATTNQALTNATNRISSLETHDGIVDGEITSLDGRVSALEQGGGGGGGGTTVDTSMSNTSTNAVQNKVIKQYVDGEVSSLNTAISNLSSAVSTNAGELKRGTISAGDTQLTLVFDASIGENTLIDVYPDPFNIVPTAISTTVHGVTITIDARAAATKFAVVVTNRS